MSDNDGRPFEEVVRLIAPPELEEGGLERRTGDIVFTIPFDQVEKAQLQILRQRFHELWDKIPALKLVTDENKITDIATLDEIVPLLLPHTAYKSYPASLITNGRFAHLNSWLNDYTVYDLEGLDVSACETLDDWLDVVEAHTPVRVTASSGTSGKCSIVPKSLVEMNNYPTSFATCFSGFRDEKGAEDFGEPSRYVILPRPRYSRHNMGRMNQAFINAYGGEDNVVTGGGELSTDVLWLTGQMRKAQADGTFEQLKKSKAWKRIQDKVDALEAAGRSPGTPEQVAQKAVAELGGKSVVSLSGYDFMWMLIDAADKQGVKVDFAEDSLFCVAGGKKLDSRTPEQKAKIREVFGDRLYDQYGFGESTHAQRACRCGHYHAPPWLIHFVLDPQTGAPLPRTGKQTGRYAAFDLWAQTYWGGFVTGDEVTIDWDGGCGCGREGPYIHDDVTRYTEKYGGDDKITCQRTAAAVAEMMEHMQTMHAGNPGR